MESFNLEPIGVIRTPYGEKFAVPRQPRLVESTHCEIELFAPYSDPQACIGLEGFSHIHVIFIFDKISMEEVAKFRPMIRPPRLGGNQRVGVFASRSPFRPSRLGLSILALDRVENRQGKSVLHVRGADMVDGTPILDIKPYIPFVDSIPDARGGFASVPPERKEVVFSLQAQAQLIAAHLDTQVLAEILSQDPRPAYKDSDDAKTYVALLMGYHVHFQVHGNTVTVITLEKADA